jgi:hypothetical protein
MAFLPGLGSDADDRASRARIDHRSRDEPRGLVCAEEVDSEDSFPSRPSRFEGVSVYDDRGAIDQAVERAELCLGRGDRGRNRRRLGKVQADGKHVPADCGRSRIERVRANVGQRDAGSLGDQLLGRCVTHAAGGTGNQDAPSLVSPRSGNFANRQRRVRRAGQELSDGIPLKTFENQR